VTYLTTPLLRLHMVANALSSAVGPLTPLAL
jgi:hypothetical protein